MATIAQLMNGEASSNRFFTSDEKRWTGEHYIGPAPAGRADNSAKRISKFIFDGPEDSPVAKLRTSYETAIDVVGRLRTKRAAEESTKHLTPFGITEKLSQEAVVGELPALKRARSTVDKLKSEVKEKRSTLKLGKPTDEQHREHVEIRAAMRAMSREQRDAFVQQHRNDPTVAYAIATAIPALSGVDPIIRQHIADQQLAREHGDVLGELQDLEEIIDVVDKATALARGEVREILGLAPDVFERFAKVGEANDGELPMRIENREIDGKSVEITRVYDKAANQWRDAQADELKARAA